MIYAGVDYGTRRIAIACVGDQQAVMELDFAIKSKSKKAQREWEDLEDTLWKLHAAALAFFELWRPTLVCVERPITGKSGDANTAAAMAQVSGVMLLAARQVGAGAFQLPPSTWKKDVCGYGALDKDGVERWLREHRPDLHGLCESQDSVDACCLALAAEAFLEG